MFVTRPVLREYFHYLLLIFDKLIKLRSFAISFTLRLMRDGLGDLQPVYTTVRTVVVRIASNQFDPRGTFTLAVLDRPQFDL